MELYLKPLGPGSVTDLTAEPIALANWEAVNSILFDPTTISYVYNTVLTRRDLYDIDTIPSALDLSVSSVQSVCYCKEIASPGEVKMSVFVNASSYYSTSFPLTASFDYYRFTWLTNPDTETFWQLSDIQSMEAGVELTSATESHCAQLYLIVNVDVVGEKISNSSFYQPSDVIHINQGFSIISKEDQGRSLLEATTIQIKYKDPTGVEGTLTGTVVDQNAIFATLPAATNTKTGKWWFKLYAVLAGGEILEGVPFFTNVQPEWI